MLHLRWRRVAAVVRRCIHFFTAWLIFIVILWDFRFDCATSYSCKSWRLGLFLLFNDANSSLSRIGRACFGFCDRFQALHFTRGISWTTLSHILGTRASLWTNILLLRLVTACGLLFSSKSHFEIRWRLQNAFLCRIRKHLALRAGTVNACRSQLIKPHLLHLKKLSVIILTSVNKNIFDVHFPVQGEILKTKLIFFATVVRIIFLALRIAVSVHINVLFLRILRYWVHLLVSFLNLFELLYALIQTVLELTDFLRRG